MKKRFLMVIFLLLLIPLEFGNLAQAPGDKGSFAVEEGDKFTYKVELLDEAVDLEGDGSTKAMKDPDSQKLVTEGDELKFEITAASATSVTGKMTYADDGTYEEIFTNDTNTLGMKVLTTGWEYWALAAQGMKVVFPDTVVTEDSDTFGFEYSMPIPPAGAMNLSINVVYSKDNGVFETAHQKMIYGNNGSLIWELKIVKTDDGGNGSSIPGFTLTPLIFMALLTLPVVYFSKRR
ncbi:MAG: hypothetical protein ACXAC7_12105 [Candidatus Hodarchaeales archaeon]